MPFDTVEAALEADGEALSLNEVLHWVREVAA